MLVSMPIALFVTANDVNQAVKKGNEKNSRMWNEISDRIPCYQQHDRVMTCCSMTFCFFFEGL